MKLLNVLDMIVNDNEELLPKDQYAFKICDNASKRKKSISGNGFANFSELLEYKVMNGANIFDMSTEIRNLPCLELELIRVIPTTRRSGYSANTPRSPNVSGLHIKNRPRVFNFQEDHKSEDCYIFNNISATSYDVKFLFTFRNFW